MRRVENGGPAYPSMNISKQSGSNVIHTVTKEGMSLRDAFAIAALPGVMARMNDAMTFPQNVSAHAYRIADAMLAARQGGGS